MSAQHTPGPWTTDGRMIVQNVDGRSFWPGQPFIADCLVSEAIRTHSTAANATLIASAPNLLAACRAVVANWERGDLAAAVRQCAKAIAAAEGEGK